MIPGKSLRVMVKNIHGHTLERLGLSVVSGRHAIGASLPPEPVLCEQMGVSRTVVREAIKSLAAKGLLSLVPSWARVCARPTNGTGLIRTSLPGRRSLA
jgi:DNA-binding GntR family transcriptional regulator